MYFILNVESDRKCTDLVCTFGGLLFTIVLILFALFMYNYSTIYIDIAHEIRTSFPSDSQGRVCGLEVKGYPYIYFANFPKIVQIKTIRIDEFVSLHAQLRIQQL